VASGGPNTLRALRLVLLPLALIAVVATIGLASRDEAREVALQSDVQLVEVGRFAEPVYLTSPPGDERLFVVERAGRIWVLEQGRRLRRPFLDLSRRVSIGYIEEGLLSVAFPPDYDSSGRFYVDYTDRRHRTIVEEFRRSSNPDVGDPETARRILVIPNPTRGHHGGLALFGPDGRLYIGQGDGGATTRTTFPAQSLDQLHGKILRIDPRPEGKRPYGSPPDNPFVDGPGRDEIWAYGLRNPWRFSFDPATGALVIGDVGSLSVEEMDIATSAGLNFGWSCFEGTVALGRSGPASCDESVPPVLEHFRGSTLLDAREDATPVVTRGRPRVDVRFTPGEPVCSIVAGSVVRDPALPSLAGRFVYGDFCDPRLRSFRIEDETAVDQRLLGLNVPGLSSFGVDSAGHVYALSLSGPVYRLEQR
jgi:hypothetical protein